MNEGYLSIILLIIVLILLASGWRTLLFIDTPPLVLTVFFTLWILGMFVQLSLSESLKMQGIYLAWVVLVWIAIRYAKWPGALYFLFTGFFTGLIGYFVQHIYTLDPVLVVINSRIDLAVLLAFITWTVSRMPLIQAVNVAVALIVVESLQLHLKQTEQTMLLGGPGIQDIWWMSYLAVRVCGALSESLSSLIQLFLKHLPIWMGGSRK